MRILFVVPPFVGHVNPTVSIASALVDAGHDVAWAGHVEQIAGLLPANARVVSLGTLPADVLADPAGRRLRDFASLRWLWERILVPLARMMTPAVERAARELRPDVIVSDQQAIGGALAARRLQIPWVTLCTTTAPLVDPFEVLPKVQAWVDGHLASLQEDAGLPVLPAGDLSPRLTLVLSTPAFTGERDYPSSFRFVGPAITGRPDPTPFEWAALAPVPRVLVSLGTISAERGARFYRAVMEGVSGAQLIIAAPPGLVPDPPAHVIVRPRVPQLALLPHVDAVVTHAGHNTVCEALAHGVPLVCAPIRDDQPVVARLVVEAGAGLRVRFGHASPALIGEAVRRVLEEPQFASAARAIQTSFIEAGGARRAAELIADVA